MSRGNTSFTQYRLVGNCCINLFLPLKLMVTPAGQSEILHSNMVGFKTLLPHDSKGKYESRGACCICFMCEKQSCPSWQEKEKKQRTNHWITLTSWVEGKWYRKTEKTQILEDSPVMCWPLNCTVRAESRLCCVSVWLVDGVRKESSRARRPSDALMFRPESSSFCPSRERWAWDWRWEESPWMAHRPCGEEEETTK